MFKKLKNKLHSTLSVNDSKENDNITDGITTNNYIDSQNNSYDTENSVYNTPTESDDKLDDMIKAIKEITDNYKSERNNISYNATNYVRLFDGEIIDLKNISDTKILGLLKEIEPYLKLYSELVKPVQLSENALNQEQLFEDAVNIILEYGRASISFLQRKLGIGYSRASEIMEQLEEKGIIDPPNGAKPREININKQQWLQMKMNSNNSEYHERKSLDDEVNIDVHRLAVKLHFYQDYISLFKILANDKSDKTIAKLIDDLKKYYANFVADFEPNIDYYIVRSLIKVNDTTFLIDKEEIRQSVICCLNEELNYAKKFFGNIDNKIDYSEFPNIIVENVDFKNFEYNIEYLMSRCIPYVSKFMLINIGILKNMSKFDGYPQLIVPVILDERKSHAALGWVNSEMHKRYSKFSENVVYSIEEYNEYIKTHNADLEQMPYLFIVIDDIYVYGLQNDNSFSDETCNCLLELAVKGRNAGIRLILGTSVKTSYFKKLKQLESVMSVVTMTGLETICQGKCINFASERDTIDGHEFEFVCADILRLRGYKNIKVTRGSGDQGVDVTAERDGIKYAIQSKYYSNPVGNNAVQEIYTGMQYYKAHIGIIMTNSTFTTSAKELAEKLGIVLWDGSFLAPYLNEL